MTDSPDYRKYLEQKFSGLTTAMNAQFYEVHGRLDSIEKQTIKTNGRVNDLEKWKEGCDGEKRNDKDHKTEKRAEVLKWVAIATGIVMFIGVCLSAYFSIHGSMATKKNSDKIDNLGQPVVTDKRGGVIELPIGTQFKFYPKDFAGKPDQRYIDSLKKRYNIK